MVVIIDCRLSHGRFLPKILAVMRADAEDGRATEREPLASAPALRERGHRRFARRPI
jgi:hypothetical protein